MGYFVTSIRDNPELAVFLTLAVGFVIGRLRIGSFTLGNVVGTLLAGVLIGQLDIRVPPLVKTVFFDLFLFATGYKVGPQFFRGLKKNALTQVSLTIVLCLTSLAVTVAAAKIFGYDPRHRGGADGRRVHRVHGDRHGGRHDQPARPARRREDADAEQHPHGVRRQLPGRNRLRRVAAIGARAAAAPGGPEGGEPQARSRDVRGDPPRFRLALRVPGLGHPRVPRPRRLVQPERGRRGALLLAQPRLRAAPAPRRPIVESNPETVLQADDVVAIAARRPLFFAAGAPFGAEVEDRELLDFPLLVADVVLTNRDLAEHTLAELGEQHGRGVVLVKMIRGGEEMPFTAATVLDRGDLLRIAGARQDVERVGNVLGYIERGTSETDVVFVGLGIVIGGFVGLLSVTIGHLPLSLTASGGALVMGLVFGWLRSTRPTFGRIPEPALWVFDTIGLAVFIGVVGLSAGPSFVSGLRAAGPSLLVVGFFVASIPHVAALLFGRYVLKMNPLILLGACAGAGTVTAALRAIQDEAGSRLPVLGYTVPYAIGNILLTAWGPVIVMLTR